MTNGRGKLDSSTVPANSLNKAEGPATEARKGRELAKGNLPERNPLRTQGRESTPSALERVRQAASKDRKQQFTALLHHIYDVGRLRTAFLAIKKDAAAGADGETWEHYVAGAYLRSVLLGHFRYYGVPMNGPALCAFRQAVGHLWRTVLRRRSQGNHLPWRRMRRYVARWLPPARVCHPYPLVRLGVLTQGGSRMR
jgi:hypothetical protein